MSGGFAFVTAHVDPGADIAPGDVRAEAIGCFAMVEERLRALGLEFTDIVKTRLLYTEREDFPEMNSVRDPLYRGRFAPGGFPSATGLVTGGRDGAVPRFEMEVIARRGRTPLMADGVVRRWGDVSPPFTHANVAGDAVFLSGQGPWNEAGELLGTTTAEQVTATLGTVVPILAAAGRTMADVVSMTAYLTPAGMRSADPATGALLEFLEAHGLDAAPPILTVLPVDDLAFPGMEVEIEVIAGPPGRRGVRMGSAAPTRSPVGLLPAVASAAAVGDLLLAGAGEVSASGDAQEAAECARDALARVEDALVDIGHRPSELGLVSVWFSPRQARAEVLEAVSGITAGWGAPIVSAVPMPAGAGAPVAVAVEAFGAPV